MNQFDRDKSELGWRAAMGLWLENRTTAPKITGWTPPERAAKIIRPWADQGNYSEIAVYEPEEITAMLLDRPKPSQAEMIEAARRYCRVRYGLDQ